MRGRLRHLRQEGGFTLVEMLTAMAVLGFIMAAFAVVVGAAVRHSHEVQNQSILQTEARATIEQLSQDLRQAYTGDSAIPPAPPIEAPMSATQLTFLSPDRAEPFHLRRISYRVTGGRLERAFATSTDTDGFPWSIPALGPWQSKVERIQNATVFTFRDAQGAVTAVPADVRTVDVQIVVATNSSPTRQFTYRSSISLRADNLQP